MSMLSLRSRLVKNCDGTFRYTPASGYVGPDEFTYEINDGLAADTATVTLDVLDGSPVADDLYYLLEDFPLEVDAAQGVLGNDHSGAGPAQLLTPPQYGTLEWFEPDGSFRYVPGPDFPGQDQFEYLAQAPGGGQEAAVVRLLRRKVGIQSLTFLNIHEITPDTGTTSYDDKHWYDKKADGAINDPEDHKYPVAYTRNTPWIVEVKLLFHNEGNPGAMSAKGKLWLYGYVYDDDGTPVKSPQNKNNPIVLSNAVPVNLNGGEKEVTVVVTANGNWPDSVQHFDDLKIVWKLVFQTPNGQSENRSLKETYNDVYLTLKSPKNLAKLYWTLVHIGSHNAEGATNEDEVILGSWDEFKDRVVKAIDPQTQLPQRTLTYYDKYTTEVVTTEDLLKQKDGQCLAWARLFVDVLRAQGIDRPNDRVIIIPRKGSGFLVKNWRIRDQQPMGPVAIVGHNDLPTLIAIAISRQGGFSFLAVKDKPFLPPAQNQYRWKYTQIDDLNGIPGQSEPNPKSDFGNHQFVSLDVKLPGNQFPTTIWFDPSYGTIYGAQGNHLADVNNTIAAQFVAFDDVIIDETKIGIGTGLAKHDIYLVRQPAPNEMLVTVYNSPNNPMLKDW